MHPSRRLGPITLGVSLLIPCGVVVYLTLEVGDAQRELEQMNATHDQLRNERDEHQQARRSLETRLATATDRIATLQAGARAKGEARPLVNSPSARDPDLRALQSSRDAYRTRLEADGPEVTLGLLAEALARGEFTALDLMNLAVALPELIVAGLNDTDLAEQFRAILVSSLESVADPLALMGDIAVESEPSLSLSARMAALVSDEIDGSVELDERACPVIQRLLAGNDMHGNKVNLYPTLAQFAVRGDAEALAIVDGFLKGNSFFRPGLEALLYPPERDPSGELSARE